MTAPGKTTYYIEPQKLHCKLPCAWTTHLERQHSPINPSLVLVIWLWGLCFASEVTYRT